MHALRNLLFFPLFSSAIAAPLRTSIRIAGSDIATNAYEETPDGTFTSETHGVLGPNKIEIDAAPATTIVRFIVPIQKFFGLVAGYESLAEDPMVELLRAVQTVHCGGKYPSLVEFEIVK